MKNFTLVLLLLISVTLNAQFLNKVNSEPLEGLVFGNPVLDQQIMIYQAQKDNHYSLWSLNINTKTKEKLITFEGGQRAQQITALNGLFYFVVSAINSDRLLWQTDGTQTGTKQVSTQPLGSNGFFTVVGGALLAQAEDASMLQLLNNTLVRRELSFDSVKQICAFSSEDIVVFAHNEESGIYSLKRLDGDSFVDVFEVTTNPISNVKYTFANDTCYFSCLMESTNLSKIVKITSSDEYAVLPLDHEIPEVSSLFSHDGMLFVVAGSEPTPNKIYRLSGNLTSFDREVTVLDGFYISSAAPKNHLISIVVSEDRFEGYSIHGFLDADLNAVPSYFNLSQFNMNNAHEIGSEVVIGFNTYENDTLIQRIKADNEVSLLSIKNFGFRQIISSDNGQELYLTLTNEKTRTTDIYSLSEKPVLNDLINGAWIEPDVISQGLVIQKGRRLDGSDYLFATFYTFDQGEPLWLAGDSNLPPEQRELTMNLFAYNGLQLFEYDQTANRELFGEMVLELENCNTIKVTIASENYNDSFPFYRIDDSSYNHLCADINPLDFESANKLDTFLEKGHE